MVPGIKLPRLTGDIGFRKVQAQKGRLQVGQLILGDGFAVPFRIETVDQHPLEAGKGSDRLDRQPPQFGQRRGVAQPDHRARKGGGKGAESGRLGFHDDETVMAMDREVHHGVTMG